MKNTVRILSLILSIIFVVFAFASCGKKAENKVDDVTTEFRDESDEPAEEEDGFATVADTFDEIKANVKKDLESAENVTEAKVKVAVKYITDKAANIDHADDETKAKFAYYAEYLKQMGDKVYALGGNSLKTIGEKASEISQNLDADAKADVSKIKEELSSATDTVKESIDSLATAIVDMFKN